MTVKDLMTRLNQVVKSNIGKAIYALFLMLITELVCMSVFVIPAQFRLLGENITLQTKLFSFLCFAGAAIVYITFQFGFSILLLKLVRKEPVTLGYIFLGFRRFRICWKIIIAFMAIFTVSAVISGFAMNFLYKRFVENKYDEFSSLYLQVGFFALIFFIVTFIISIHFVFVFHIHFDNYKTPLSKVFSKSAEMMHGNVFKLLFFAIRAGGKNLATAIFLNILISLASPSSSSSSGLSILTFLFDFIYFVNLYTAIVKIYFAVPIMYTAILEEKNEPSKIIPEALIESDVKNADS